jgi:hypothetical protein
VELARAAPKPALSAEKTTGTELMAVVLPLKGRMKI